MLKSFLIWCCWVHSFHFLFAQTGRIGEESFVFKKIPDVAIRSTRQPQQNLSFYYRDKPVIITMVFTRCSGICYPFLTYLKNELPGIGGLGKDYHMLVLSFDPEDSLSDMEKMSVNLQLEHDSDWIFAVTGENEIRSLMAATGFLIRWNPVKKEYDHTVLLIGVDTHGRVVSRQTAFTGKKNIRLLVNELQQIFVPSAPVQTSQTSYRCFDFDPETGSWKPGSGTLLLLLPPVITIFIVSLIPLVARKKKR